MIRVAPGVDPPVRIDIWSDVVCPWCYIGKRRFETALGRFEHAADVEVVWRSFELDPAGPRQRDGHLVDLLAAKYGMSREEAEAANARVTALAADEGLAYRLEAARPANTFDAHRLIHLAASRGLGGRAKETFLAAYFTEGAALGDRDTLAGLAARVGLDAEEVAAVLDSDAFAADVRVDEQEAHQLGVTGVPCFVIDGRFAVAGAQSPELLLQAMRRVWALAADATGAVG